TRASVARENGLQGLADLILAQGRDRPGPAELARSYLNETITTVDQALAGARDIVAEIISDDADVRRRTRDKGLRWASLTCQKTKSAEDPRGVFKIYYDYRGRVDRLRPHQILAINRGQAEKVLRVNIEVAERDWRWAIGAIYRIDGRSPLAEQLALAIDDAAARLLLPAIGRDIRRALTEDAEAHALEVFQTNLENLLLQPPLAGHTILGIDPGYRTGCKVAVVDATGRVLETGAIYPHAPQKQWRKSQATLAEMARRYQVSLMAIGNGTASRETEQLAADLIRNDSAAPEREVDSAAGNSSTSDLRYLIVNEAGASVYSASPLAKEELPDLDVTLRGAVSIARRVQDPLAELVKIDPRSIGVGLYQHDVNQKRLAQALEGVVEKVVNRVGVDVNTASPALLTYVAGVGPKLAAAICDKRDDAGAFKTRKALKDVPGLGPKAFEQAAGFLRIRDGENPLDASAIHPESYVAAKSILDQSNLTLDTPPAERAAALARWQAPVAQKDLAGQLGLGLPTLTDILEQLARPGRDPRTDLPPPILRSDILSMDDLRPGQRLKGTVRNVVDFGAFVDIGVKQDGLLHRSQWPREAHFGVGDVVEVSILQVEIDRGRISLGWVES
ncbi:MAG: helix-hairpin-helix domain-containing protein, partial [Chloroflexota bacterium]